MRVFVLFLSVLTMMVCMGGCDEGMGIVKPIVKGPEEKPQTQEEPITFYIHGDGTSDILASEHIQENLAQNEQDFVGVFLFRKFIQK